MRPSKRKNNELREISIEVGVLNSAEGSCLIKFGGTHVICSASVEESLPPFLKGKGKGGWVTAEYGMLPRSTNERMRREASQGKQSGRTQEIQRLLGRSLRAVVDLYKLGERQILIDCDVINADGGTRTAAITGAYVAMYVAISKIMSKGLLRQNPVVGQVAAISCGIREGETILDLDYIEDSDAEVDANFVMTSDARIIEIQATAEKEPFTENQLVEMLTLARKGTSDLFKLQNKSILKL